MLYFNDLFDDLFESVSYKEELKTDILESKGAYLVSMDIPGVSKEDVSIDYDDDILNVSINAKDDDLKDAEYVIRERRHLSAKRSFRISGIDETGIKAKFACGVLEVVLPKKEVKETKKLIEIE